MPFQVDLKKEEDGGFGGLLSGLVALERGSWPSYSYHGFRLKCCFLVLTWMFWDTSSLRGMRVSCAPSMVITGSYRGLHKFR